MLLPAVEQRVAAAAPGVDLHLSPLVPETMQDLRDGRVDVAIGIFPDAPPEVRQRRLFTDRFVTVARVGHPRVAEGRLDRAAFLAEPHVLVSPRGGRTGLVDDVLAREGQARRVARTYPSFFAALWHVLHADALLTVSERLVHATAAHLPLRVHPPPLPLPTYDLQLVWHPRVDRDPAHGWFRGVLAAAGASLPALG